MTVLLLLFLNICIFSIVIIFLVKIVKDIYSYFFWGAIYVPTSEKNVEQMMSFVDLKFVKKAVDLGSGDGRLVVALAKAGIEAYGYEINPFLVSLSKKNIEKAGVNKKAFVFLKNLWNENLEDFDVVFIFGMKHVMKKLEKKLDKGLKPGTVVVSNYFVFPNWRYSKKRGDVYLYIKK